MPNGSPPCTKLGNCASLPPSPLYPNYRQQLIWRVWTHFRRDTSLTANPETTPFLPIKLTKPKISTRPSQPKILIGTYYYELYNQYAPRYIYHQRYYETYPNYLFPNQSYTTRNQNLVPNSSLSYKNNYEICKSL